MSRPRARSIAPIALALAFAAAREARGNGRFPAAQMVQVGPGADATTVVVRTTFGLLRSNDGGARWSWHCEDMFGYGGQSNWDPPFAITRGDDGIALMVGLPAGLARALDHCANTRNADVGMTFTADVTSTADGRSLYWVGANGVDANRVFFSSDGGRTFSPRGTAPDGVLILTVEAAPTDPERVYFTGITTTATPVDYFFRSDDGGRTLRRIDLDLRGARTAWISAVDPTDRDTVYVRAVVDDPDAGDPILGSPTVLLRTRDGGASFDEVTRTRGPMLGFALSGDGRTVWTGGPHEDDRLRRSVDGGPFERVSSAQSLCLRWHAGALYVCGNHLSEGYSLARSTDDGRTLTPLLRFSELSAPSGCARGTPGADLCAPRWPIVARFFASPDAGLDAGSDDAAVLAPPSNHEGCRCTAAGKNHGAPRAWGWIALAAACVSARRRR